MTTEKETGAKVDLGLLEEDDEFEEFPADGEWALSSELVGIICRMTESYILKT